MCSHGWTCSVYWCQYVDPCVCLFFVSSLISMQWVGVQEYKHTVWCNGRSDAEHTSETLSRLKHWCLFENCNVMYASKSHDAAEPLWTSEPVYASADFPRLWPRMSNVSDLSTGIWTSNVRNCQPMWSMSQIVADHTRRPPPPAYSYRCRRCTPPHAEGPATGEKSGNNHKV